METRNNIFYRPELGIERDYSSDGSFVHEISSGDFEEKAKTPAEKLLEKAEEIGEKLINMKTTVAVLPESVSKVISDINNYLFFDNEIKKNEISKIISREAEPDGKEEAGKDTETSENRTDDTQPTFQGAYVDEDGFVWEDYTGSGITVSVKKAKSNSEQAREQYLLDSTELKEEYLVQLEDMLSKFVNPLLVYMGETGISRKYYLDQDYDGPEIKNVPKGAGHLHDTVVRNAVITNEFSLLVEKTHSVYNTLNVFAAFDAVSQQRVRYYSENYDNEISGYLDVFRNNALTECRNAYDEKYTLCKLNIYKYLSSAVKACNDICQADLQSKAAKCFLLREDIDIYATQKYETSAVNNAAVKDVASEVKIN